MPIKPKQSLPEPLLRTSLRREIEHGLAASRDPANAALPDLTCRITTIYSPWYTRPCPVCKQNFREEDRVRLCPWCGQAYHDDDQYNLHCWQEHFAAQQVCKIPRRDPITGKEKKGCPYRWSGKFPDDPQAKSGQQAVIRRVAGISAQFLGGLEGVWTPYGGEDVIEVQPEDPIVGYNCPWCRFQIRAGDRVVKCPCGQCNTYFHDDIFRHLTCWNEWNGSRGHDYCPTTGAKIIRAQPITATGSANEP